MRTYIFSVVISGVGVDAEAGWYNAVESFNNDPGSVPEGYEVVQKEWEGLEMD